MIDAVIQFTRHRLLFIQSQSSLSNNYNSSNDLMSSFTNDDVDLILDLVPYHASQGHAVYWHPAPQFFGSPRVGVYFGTPAPMEPPYVLRAFEPCVWGLLAVILIFLPLIDRLCRNWTKRIEKKFADEKQQQPQSQPKRKQNDRLRYFGALACQQFSMKDLNWVAASWLLVCLMIKVSIYCAIITIFTDAPLTPEGKVANLPPPSIPNNMTLSPINHNLMMNHVNSSKNQV